MNNKLKTIAAFFLMGLISHGTALAATVLDVDCGDRIGPVTHCASGSLYGVTEDTPADIDTLVVPLHSHVFTNPARSGGGFQQPVGAAIPVAERMGDNASIMIRLADICPKWPYVYPGTSAWLDKVSSVIHDKKGTTSKNFYGYEIWNEPVYTWSNVNGEFTTMWKKTYQLIRKKDSEAKIIGPSEGFYDHERMRDFLAFCQKNDCLPDIVSWHELGANGKGVESVSSNIDDYRMLEKSLNIAPRAISINEYCDPNHKKEGAPGPSARYIAKFERKKIDSACISWWWTAYPGHLGSLLTNEGEKGGGWWFYYWYGQMTGDMVTVNPPDDASILVDGFACVDAKAKYVSVLLGGNNDGTINVVIDNIPSFIGNKAHIVLEKTAWNIKNPLVEAPSSLGENDCLVENNKINVTINNANNLDGYRIYVTAGK